MKRIFLASGVALVALLSPNIASAQIIDLQYGATLSDTSIPFVETFSISPLDFEPSELNSILSATLTAFPSGSSATGTLTTAVTLDNTTTHTSVPVPSQTLTLALSTTTSTSSTAETSGYPATYDSGPTGFYNQITVTVTASNLSHGVISFTGDTELIPEPSTWALLLSGAGMLVFLAVRRTGENPI